MDGRRRYGDLSSPKVNCSRDSSDFSNLPGVNGTCSIARTSTRMEDCPRTDGSLGLREADIESVRSSILEDSLVCMVSFHACASVLELAEGALSFFGLEEGLLPCLCTCFLAFQQGYGTRLVAVVPSEPDYLCSLRGMPGCLRPMYGGDRDLTEASWRLP